MKKLILLTTLLLAQIACSQLMNTSPVPAVEKDSATGAIKKFDYNLPLSGISDPGMLLAHFSQRPLLIFYYSPKCPHCQATYPKIAKIANDYSPYGLTVIAVSIGQAKKNDIRAFMDQFGVDIPMFQDVAGKFSEKYGSGHVPLNVLVKSNGEYIRYTENSDAQLQELIAEIDKITKGKK